MQSIPDKDFDAFIRKTVEEPKLQFDPQAWKAMEKKLDSRPGYFASGGIDIFSILALLLMFSYLPWNESNFKNNGSGKSETITAGTNILNFQIFKDPGKTSLVLKNKAPENKNKDKDKVNQKSLFSDNLGNTQKIEENKNLSKISPAIDQKISSGIKDLPIETDNQANNSLAKKPFNEKDFNIPDEIKKSGMSIINVEKKSFNTLDSELHPQKKKVVLTGANVEILPQIEHFRQPKWGINLMVSPDLSAVKLSEMRSSGTNLGISIEYYLSSRWRISLGAIRSVKIYSVGESYSSGYNYNPQKTEFIDANCSVIDIPLILRFNALSTGKNHLFISSGLSSYLMLKEDYNFTYHQQNSTYTYSKNIRNENNHFFKILNFSIGYEREIGRKFSLQAEPFIKAPISDIGYGKIKLLTTGAFFSLKYKIY